VTSSYCIQSPNEIIDKVNLLRHEDSAENSGGLSGSRCIFRFTKFEVRQLPFSTFILSLYDSIVIILNFDFSPYLESNIKLLKHWPF
jgi:hypothetical protein